MAVAPNQITHFCIFEDVGLSMRQVDGESKYKIERERAK
jgi:hypothetical protein